MPSSLKKRLAFQIALTFAIALILFALDFVFLESKFADRFPRRWMSLPETWGIVYLLSLAFKRRGLWVCTVILFVMTYIQMLNLSFFGTFLHPTALYLFFTQFGEVWETTLSFLGQLIYPTSLFIGALVAGWVLLKRFPAFQEVQWRPFKWILAVTLIYCPARTFITGNTYGKQPAVQNMAFSNSYATFSYFLGRTLPFKLTHRAQAEHLPPLAVLEKNPGINVIFILGESLRYDNMSLFGYSRPTTPNLEEFAKSKGLIFRKGISGGVSTDVSIPLLVNNTMSSNPVPVISSQGRCLYKLAKDNGFATSFFSAQTQTSLQHILNYICPGSIDQVQLGAPFGIEDKDLKFNDEILIEDLRKVDFSKPQFVILHQRGSHSPYEMRYPPEAAIYKPEPGDSDAQKMIKAYDNSIHYTDRILKELIELAFQKSNRPTYIVFTSDHGQALGENGAWGHVMLNEYVMRVPFFMIANRDNPISNTVKQWPEVVAHHDVSNLLIRLLGYESPIQPAADRTAFVMGADLDGLEGGMLVRIHSGQIKGFERAEEERAQSVD